MPRLKRNRKSDKQRQADDRLRKRLSIPQLLSVSHLQKMQREKQVLLIKLRHIISLNRPVNQVSPLHSSSPESLLQLVGDSSTEIPDAVITAALQLLIAHQPTGHRCYIGYYMPAQIHLFTINQQHGAMMNVPTIPLDQDSINIHPLTNHWVTSFFSVNLNQLFVYDSLMSDSHRKQVCQQLTILYGQEVASQMKYSYVTQQSVYPICGVMAIAFAFSCFLGHKPSTQRYNIHTARAHLRQCILNGEVKCFPLQNVETTDDWLSNYMKDQTVRQKQTLKKQNLQRKCDSVSAVMNNRKIFEAQRKANYRKRKNTEMSVEELKAGKLIEQNRIKKFRHNNRLQLTEEEIQLEKMCEQQRLKKLRQKKRSTVEEVHKQKVNERERLKKLRDTLRSKSTDQEVHKQKVNQRERRKKLRDTLRSKSTDQEVHKQKVNQRERRKKLRDTLRSKSTDQEVHKQKVNQRERRKKLRDTLRSKSTDQEVHKQKVNERERLKRLRKQRISMRTAEENEQEILKSRERVKTHRKKTRQFACPELLKKQRSVNNYRKSTKRHQQNVQTAIKKFKNNIRDYAKYVCTCCNRLMYRRSVLHVNASSFPNITEELRKKCLRGKKSAHGFEWICLTCRSYLKKQRLPLQAQANNLEVPAAPPVLSELSSLEVRLLCKRYPFMKLVALPKGRQSGIKGSVVNVPVNCEQVCSTLPRTPGTAGIIPLKLKRKQQYKGYVKFQYIRPEKIMLALRWLQKHNVHYKNIEENSSWLDDTLNEDQDTFNELIKDKPTLEDDDTDTSQIIMQTNDNEKVSSSSHTQVVSSSDSDSDIENANDPGDTLRGLHYDTCVQSVNPNLDVDKILSIAPGENKIPMSILMDTNFEEMSFPSLFPTGQFGFRAERPVKLTAKKYFQERLLDASTIFARDVEYLFVAQTIIERQQIQDSMSVALRKTYTADENEQLTASIVRDTSLVKKYLLKDQAYRYLQPVRGSPPYWQKVQLKLLSAIKQFGIFTWFFTLSAADLRWYDTIQEILSQKGIEKTEAAIDAMTWEQKCDILRSNPVSAARHFQFRLDLFMKDMILSDSQPLGHVRHFFYRIEFQQRGSPHAHGVLWIDDAPDVEHSKPEDVSEFIDKYVQCSLPAGNEDPELFALVNQVQRHSHTASCRKSGKQCRFGFPRPLSSKTILSKPPDLSETLPHLIPVLRQKNLKIAGVVNEFLEKTENLENMTYEEVLKACQLPANVYQEALSKSASSPKVYLKRDPNSVNINNYNASLLSAWQANLDVQFVTDPYACIQYVVSYITKDEREMGSLLHAVAKESAQDTIKEQMKKCGQAFLNSRSVTAQEAANRALGLPLYKSNFSTVWIPTGLPSQRISLLKPSYVLQRLDDMDNDVFVCGIADKYSKRPGVLEMWCLAQFATWYEPTQKDKVQSDFQPDILTDHYNIGENAVDTSVEDAPKVIKVQLPSSVCVMRKRKKQCVIRFHKFSQEKQPESHYHSQLYLFLPWRNEIEDLQDRYDSYEESYNNHKLTIEKCRSTLFRHEKLVEAAFEQLQAEDQPREAWNQLAAENQQEEYDAEDEGVALDEDHAILHPGDQENLSVNISTPAKDCVQGLAIESMTSVLPYNDYCRHVRTLNTEQYQVFQVILNWCVRYMQSVNNTTVQKPDPIHLFISGGAGTGKSHLISALYQTIELNLRKEGDTPDCPKVLLLAPTGTAAFNIQGATIHAALLFSLLQQSASRKSSSATTHPLSDDKRNTLRVKMSQLKFIIIDEISMVASDFFVEIHKRLTEIFAVEDIFGGLSIITVGDMYQLPPVAARFIFEPPRNAFAALCP
ncbi:uncharacterized protein LOC128237946 [Mya arenaria]|uniref:uncharacterized protein LOC128237946 n=1 Tax=Mya arenaria TaxID=6604 RepID=UPI0022DF8A81|nr:uncharacterized protein LOC128237946 [Mya arenaria]